MVIYLRMQSTLLSVKLNSNLISLTLFAILSDPFLFTDKKHVCQKLYLFETLNQNRRVSVNRSSEVHLGNECRTAMSWRPFRASPIFLMLGTYLSISIQISTNGGGPKCWSCSDCRWWIIDVLLAIRCGKHIFLGSAVKLKWPISIDSV